MTDFPLRQCLGAATALLRWPPEVFWSVTPHEFMAAMNAHARIEGAVPADKVPDIERLKALVDATLHRSHSIRRAGR